MIDLKFTCPQSLADLKPRRDGFFCKDCNKCIVDFRGKSSEEIADFIRKAPGEVCGIIDKYQVYSPSYGLLNTRFKLAFIIVFLLGFCANDLWGQTEMDSTILIEQQSYHHQNFRVEGIVYDQDSIPLPFARIKIIQGDQIYFTNSNVEGRFAIEFKQNGTEFISVEVSSIMFETSLFAGIPTEDGQVILEVFLKETTGDLFMVGIMIELDGDNSVAPPTDPYEFGVTKMNAEDLRHRP